MMFDLVDYLIFEEAFGYDCPTCGNLLLSYADAYGAGLPLTVECDQCGCLVEVEG